MADIFSSARLLVRGAREDIDKLDAAFNEYLRSNPYTQVVETDLKGGTDTYKIKIAKGIDALLSRDTARIGNDLRSALDQAGYATALASGNRRLKQTYFPFAADGSKIDSVVKGRCKDLPQEIAALFRSFNAYRGGDNELWALNEIANGVKHRFIVPVGHGVGAAIIDNFDCNGLIRMAMPPTWDSTKDEMVLFVTVQGSHVNYNLNLAFYIAFGDIEVVRGRQVTETLIFLAHKATAIINATESKTREIGLIS